MFSLGVAVPLFANDTQDITVQATIESLNPAFDIAVTPIDATTDSWGTTDDSPSYTIDFGTLNADYDNNILLPDDYYAVDVGIVSNTGWQVTHDATGLGELNDNVNVTFVTTDGSTDSELEKVSFSNSNGQSYTDSDFGTGEWLRIYYGIGTGDGNDAAGVEPIGLDTPTGTYQGTVTLTVTQT